MCKNCMKMLSTILIIFVNINVEFFLGIVLKCKIRRNVIDDAGSNTFNWLSGDRESVS